MIGGTKEMRKGARDEGRGKEGVGGTKEKKAGRD